MGNSYSRRRFVEKGGVVSAVLLAGCTGGNTEPTNTETNTPTSDGTGNGDQTATETESDSEVETETETESEDGTITAGEWPQFQFDAQNTGHNPDGTGPKQDIRARWRFEVGTAVRTAPVVKNGMVYVNADQLYALSTEDGSVKWTFAPSGGGSSPAVGNRTVYVAGAGNTVYGVQADNGTERWQQSHTQGLSTPTVKSPRVFFSSSTGLGAFDLKTGDKLWSITTDHSPFHWAPIVADGTVIAADGRRVRGYDVGDGSHYRNYSLYGDSVPLSAIDDIFYIVEQGKTVQQVSVSGGIQSQIGVEQMILSSPVVTPNSVYLSTESNLMRGMTLEGDTQWSFDTGADSKSAPALVDDALYFGSNDRNVYAVDANTGDELWSFETDRIVQSAPAVAGGTVYIGSDDGYVYALAEE